MYTALHEDAAAAGRMVQVGIVKDLFQFHPFRWYNVVDQLMAWLLDKLFNKVTCRRGLGFVKPFFPVLPGGGGREGGGGVICCLI